MAAKSNARRSSRFLSRWLFVGVGILLIAVFIGLLTRGVFGGGQVKGPSTVPVRRGSITATVSGIGSVAAAQTVDLAFQGTGTVAQVLVKEGDAVKAGQPLAKLDDRALQAQVANAQAALDSAKAKLAQAQNGDAKPEDIAAARAALASAQASYDKVAKGPQAADLAAAEAAVDSAKANYDKLAAGPKSTDVDAAQAQLSSAQANYAKVAAGPKATDIAAAQAQLNSAQANYAKLAAGPNPADVAAAQAGVRSAQASLAKLLAPPAAADVAAAQAAVTQAQAQLASAQQTLADTTAKPKPDDVQNAQRALEQAKNTLNAAYISRDLTCGQHGPTSSECRSANASAQADETAVSAAADKVRQAQEPAPPAQVAAAQQGVASARAGLSSAQAKLTQVQAGPTASDKAAAQAQLDQAKATLAKAQSAVTPADLAAAQAQVAQAKQALANAQNVGTPADLAAAQAQVDQAKQTLANAQNSVTPADLAAAQSQVSQAEQNLAKVKSSVTRDDLVVAQAQIDQAQANLDKLTAPATDTDIAVAQASVAQAEQSLKQAQINLDNATLKAPFDGIVSAVNATPGASAGGTAGKPALSLIDRSALHVDLKLSENDVARVAPGQPVVLTVDARPDWRATGTVSDIAPSSETTNGVVTYAVRVVLGETDPSLRIGTTANVTITTAHKDDVLLVPNATLLPKGSGHAIQELNADGKTTRDVDVQTGLTDGTMTEITGGLNPGDRVIALPTTGVQPSHGFFG